MSIHSPSRPYLSHLSLSQCTSSLSTKPTRLFLFTFCILSVLSICMLVSTIVTTYFPSSQSYMLFKPSSVASLLPSVGGVGSWDYDTIEKLKAEFNHPDNDKVLSNWKNDKNSAKVELLIVVPSFMGVTESTHRQMVRDTWGKDILFGSDNTTESGTLNPSANSRKYNRERISYKSPNSTLSSHNSTISPSFNPLTTRVLFFIGTHNLTATNLSSLSVEQSRYNDIILLPFTETYSSLSKKMILIHRWLKYYTPSIFPQLNWLFKTDSDVFIDVPSLYNITKYNTPLRLLLGHMYMRNRVFKTGPWKSKYTAPYYPYYMAGAGYLISYDISRWIADNADAGWLKDLNNEDALLGIWMAGLNVRLVNERRIKPMIVIHGSKIDNLREGQGNSGICEEETSPIVIHNLSVGGMKRVWSDWQECGKVCGCAEIDDLTRGLREID